MQLTVSVHPLVGAEHHVFTKERFERLSSFHDAEQLAEDARFVLWSLFRSHGAMQSVDGPDADCGTMAVRRGSSILLVLDGSEDPAAVRAVRQGAEDEGIEVVDASPSPLPLGLCEGRHPIPGVSSFVFGNQIPSELLTDPEALQALAAESLASFGLVSGSALCLYATGLSVALLAVLLAAHSMGVLVTVYHYDRDADSYYPQTLSWA